MIIPNPDIWKKYKMFQTTNQLCSSDIVFFKIVLLAGAKGGLEVECLEDVRCCGVEGWCGTG